MTPNRSARTLGIEGEWCALRAMPAGTGQHWRLPSAQGKKIIGVA